MQMPSDLYAAVLKFLRVRNPFLNIKNHIAADLVEGDIPLASSATFFDHVVVKQQKFLSGRQLKQRADSLICVRAVSGSMHIGCLLDIVLVSQAGVGPYYVGFIQWLKPLIVDVKGTVWEST